MTDLSSLALSVRNLSFSYESCPVLCRISFDLSRGSFTLLLGENGVGKTTLLRICAGLLRVRDDVFLGNKPRDLRIRFSGHDAMLYEQLSVEENLQFFFALEHERVPERAFQDWQLSSLRAKRVIELSRGQRQRVSLFRSLYLPADLLILDEPTSHLDARTSALLYQTLAEHREHHASTTLLSTHNPREFSDQITDRLLLSAGTLSQVPDDPLGASCSGEAR